METNQISLKQYSLLIYQAVCLSLARSPNTNFEISLVLSLNSYSHVNKIQPMIEFIFQIEPCFQWWCLIIKLDSVPLELLLPNDYFNWKLFLNINLTIWRDQLWLQLYQKSKDDTNKITGFRLVRDRSIFFFLF